MNYVVYNKNFITNNNTISHATEKVLQEILSIDKLLIVISYF